MNFKTLNELVMRLQFSMRCVLIDSCFQPSMRSIYVHSAKQTEATCCYSLVVDWNLLNGGKAMHSILSVCPKVHSRLVRKPRSEPWLNEYQVAFTHSEFGVRERYKNSWGTALWATLFCAVWWSCTNPILFSLGFALFTSSSECGEV